MFGKIKEIGIAISERKHLEMLEKKERPEKFTVETYRRFQDQIIYLGSLASDFLVFNANMLKGVLTK